MTSRTTHRLALCVGLLALPTLAACGDDDQATVAEWTEAANTICGDINAARDEAATDAFPSEGETVTVEHLQAFYETFEPDFRAAIERMGELDRPAEIADEVDGFVTAGR